MRKCSIRTVAFLFLLILRPTDGWPQDVIGVLGIASEIAPIERQYIGDSGDWSSVHPWNDALCRPRVLCVGWTERLLKDRLLDVNPIADRD
jgi:hypothetical protein